MKNRPACPRCGANKSVKSGVLSGRQRYRCKACNYNYTVGKLGKKIDDYYVTKALQLYVEGVSYREIERLLGISHVSVMNWVKQHQVKRPAQTDYHPTYKILTHSELVNFYTQKENLSGAGMIVTELGDKYMMIKWERFRD
jgi:transposase-like protein